MPDEKEAISGQQSAVAVQPTDGGVVRLNLGAGGKNPPGFVAIGMHDDGKPVYPLAYPPNSVDEIRASHVLEHFSHQRTLEVLADWFRALKPGGLMRVAVPDFDVIIKSYQAGDGAPVEGYLMGGHADEFDVHKSIWNEQKLRESMQHVGLVDVGPWKSELNDCAALPVSLNLQGRKAAATIGAANKPFRVFAVMSAPRNGFMGNFISIYGALGPFGFPLKVVKGAFWGQCLERGMSQVLEQRPDVDAILTLDFDSVFTREDVRQLLCLMAAHPEVDALVPVQAARWRSTPLFTRRGPDGQIMNKIPMEDFAGDLMRIRTGHFGLTLIRTAALRTLPHPWFKGEPGPGGVWDDDRTDDDVWFWFQWEKAGRSAYLANRVPIGHIVETIAWPGEDIAAVLQRPEEYGAEGKPKNCWR